MEESGLLDVTNPLHLFVLHYVYSPRINAAIDSFVEAWNKHPIRTERNWSNYYYYYKHLYRANSM